MSLLRAALMSNETGRLSRCLVPHDEAAHRARGQTEGFRRGIDAHRRWTVAAHRNGYDGFALFCGTPVDGISRAETLEAMVEVGYRQGGCTAKLPDADFPKVTGTGIRDPSTTAF
jgi:hypothetical protein